MPEAGGTAVKCPHCGEQITRKQLAQGLGRITSELKAKTSAANGKKGGRPKTKPKRVAGTTAKEK